VRHHRHRLLALCALASLAALWLTAAPLASAGDPCYHDFTMPATTVETGNQIKLMGCAFAPTITQVAPGATVTFYNGPDFTHLITGANQAWGSRDVEVKPGATVSYTFEAAGIYPFACALHRGMSGTIIVGDLASAVAAGTAPGTTTSGTTSGGSAGPPAAGGSATSSSPVGSIIVVAISAVAGAVVGASAIWLSMRRRRGPVEDGVVRPA
jgi:plastocyanin